MEIGPLDLLNETLRIWAMHREFRAVLKDLKGYSDRELTELGISRADIARVAYEEAERRILAAKSGEPSGARRRRSEEDDLVLDDSEKKGGEKEKEAPAAAERKRKGHVLEDDDA